MTSGRCAHISASTLLLLLATTQQASAFTPSAPLCTRKALASRSIATLPPAAPKLAPHHSTSALMAIQYDNDGLKASKDEITSVRRIAYFALWAAFLGYAFLIAPGGDSGSVSRDMSLVKQLVTSPLTTAVNPIFVTIFNLLGVVPMIFASILFPGSRDQRPPLPPFALASLAVGFFSVGPYLALREFKPYPALPQRKWLANLVESKLFASTLVLGSTFLLGFLGVSLLNDSGKTVNEYLEMFKQSKFVHVATLDLLTLGLIGVEPMREDMKRRDWHSLPKLIGFNLLPAVGPALYLLTRPKLDTDTQQDRQKEQ